MTECRKCGYVRAESNTGPDAECPSCGAIYAKVDAHIARQEQEAAERAAEAAQREQTEAARAAADAKRQQERRLRMNVCTTCGHIGQPKTLTRGNLLIEIILWCMIFVPGLIYTIWRHSTRYKACPKCRNATMIPVSYTHLTLPTICSV